MSRSSDITISVSDPAKCTDKFGQMYVSYKITSTANRSGFSTGSITVVRRYSDFAWLSAELSREFPGVIVPPLPEKQTVGRFGSDFVESRRRGLEKLLLRISAHEEIGNSQNFIIFLQADESAMMKAKGDAKASKPPITSKAMAWFEGTVNTIANGKVELEKSSSDTKVEEISQVVLALEKQMSNATKHTEALVKRSKEMSSALFEFGQSMTWLGQSEGDAVGTALTQTGTAADTLSVAASAHAEEELVKLLEPLEEYARMLTSIKFSIQQRQEKKSCYMAAMSDLEGKQNAHKKLMGVAGKEAQASAKEQAAQSAQEVCDAAKAEYEKVTDRLLQEFETYKLQKACDVKEILLNFVNVQIDFSNKSEEVWKDVLPKIQSMSVTSTGGSGLLQSSAPVGNSSGNNPFTSGDNAYEDFSSRHQQQQQHNPYGQSNFHEQDEDDDGMVGV